jgi:hypothetical protein
LAVAKKDLENLNESFAGEKIHNMFTGGLLTDVRHNSASRIIMLSQQLQQNIIPEHPEFPPVYYGYENTFGEYANSITKSAANNRVIAVIPKFMNNPRHIYHYVVQDVLTGVYDVIEIKHYEKYSETHGYIKYMTEGDLFLPDMIIPKGQILAHAPTRDENGNYCFGIRGNVAYASWSEAEEDGFAISDEFAEKSTFSQLEETTVIVNLNTILPNIYGTKDEYKSFPDIFEDVKNNILCARRQINFTYAASELTANSLSSLLNSDKCVPGKGKVIDIDIYVNNEEELMNNTNRSQIMRYWIENKAFHQNIVNTLGKIMKQKGCMYSYQFKLLYERSLDFLNPDIQFSSANGVFDFALIKFTLANKTTLKEGYKICDRHGSKGVTCHIIPKEYMPVDMWGKRADIIQSPPSNISRSNIAQNYEHELNFIGDHVKRLMIQATTKGIEEQFQILYEFISMVDFKQGQKLKLRWKTLSKFDKMEFIADNLNTIYIPQTPFHDNITFEKMDNLYTHYDIHPSRVRMKRDFKLHKFSHAITNVDKENYFANIYNTKGEMLNLKGNSPFNNEDDVIKEISDDEFIFINEGFIPGIKEGESQVVSYNSETEEVFQLAPLYTEDDFEEKLKENWNRHDETIVTRKDNDTITRSFLSPKPLIIAEKYFIILKHVSEGKFSARYVGSTNNLGLPNKTPKAETGEVISSTPVAMDEMQLMNTLLRVEPSIVFRHLSQVSKDVEFRNKLFNVLLFEDPLTLHNIDTGNRVVLNDIPAKVLAAYLFCLGYEIIDKKEDDIYSNFDGIDLSDEQLEEIMEKHKALNPIVD